MLVGTVAAESWQEVETWNGTINAASPSWQTVETWSGTINVQCFVIETWYFRSDKLLNATQTDLMDEAFLFWNSQYTDAYLGIRIFLLNGTEIISSGTPLAVGYRNDEGFITANVSVPYKDNINQKLVVKIYYKMGSGGTWTLVQNFTSNPIIRLYASTWTVNYYVYEMYFVEMHWYFFQYGNTTYCDSRIENVSYLPLPLQWRHVETWTGKISVCPKIWQHVETWTGNINIPLQVPPGEPLLPMNFILGIVGLFGMFLGPLICISKFRSNEYYDAVRLGVIITIVGIAFFIAWLWSG